MSAPATPVQSTAAPCFTNDVRPLTPTSVATGGLFNQPARKTGPQAPILNEADDYAGMLPNYMESMGELARFAARFEDKVSEYESHQIPGGSLTTAQVRMAGLRGKAKRITARTTPTAACGALAKIVKKFNPKEFPEGMPLELVETRLGLRTPGLQADKGALLQRVMAYAQVIQLCREHKPASGKPEEFPLVVMTLQEFREIDYEDSTEEWREIVGATVQSPKMLTIEEEIEASEEALEEFGTIPASTAALKMAEQTRLAELEQRMDRTIAALESMQDSGLAERRARQLNYVASRNLFEDYAIDRAQTEDARPSKQARMDQHGDSIDYSGNATGLDNMIASSKQFPTIEEQRQARLSAPVPPSKLSHRNVYQEVISKLRRQEKIRMDWLFTLVSTSSADGGKMIILNDEDQVDSVIKSNRVAKAKIRTISDILRAYQAFSDSVLVVLPILGQAIMEKFMYTIHNVYDRSNQNVEITALYTEEHINLALKANNLGQCTELTLDVTLYEEVVQLHKVRHPTTFSDYKSGKKGGRHGHKDKDPNSPTTPRPWTGPPSDNQCKNWDVGNTCAYAMTNGKCPFKHEGTKGAKRR